MLLPNSTNKAYIKVTAEDGVTAKIYTLNIFSIIGDTDFNIQKNSNFSLNLDGINSSNNYQLWTEELSDDGTSYWRLIKKFDDSFDGAVTNGQATKSWTMEGNLANKYKIHIRVKDSNGNLIDSTTKEFSAKEAGVFKIDELKINEMVPIGTTILQAGSTPVINAFATKSTNNNNQIIFEYYYNNQLVQSSNNSQYNLTIPNDAKPGMNTIKVVAYQEGTPLNKDTTEVKIIVVNPNAIVPEFTGDGFALANMANKNEAIPLNMSNNILNGANAKYKFSISEPMKVAFATINSANTTYSFLYPGLYQVFGSVSDKNSNSISDGAIKTIRINRPNGETAKKINRNAVIIEKKATEQEPYSMTALNSINKTEFIRITAPTDNNAEYSFYRLDARGYQLIQDWSSNKELLWKPMQAGKYTIQIRIRDKAYTNTNASYEDAQGFAFNINGAEQTITNVVITAPDTGAKRVPIEISANATAPRSDNVMYRFEVMDNLWGNLTIADYSMNNTATFIPRKAGTFTLRVLARDANNYGYYDVLAEKVMTIS